MSEWKTLDEFDVFYQISPSNKYHPFYNTDVPGEYQCEILDLIKCIMDYGIEGVRVRPKQ